MLSRLCFHETNHESERSVRVFIYIYVCGRVYVCIELHPPTHTHTPTRETTFDPAVRSIQNDQAAKRNASMCDGALCVLHLHTSGPRTSLWETHLLSKYLGISIFSLVPDFDMLISGAVAVWRSVFFF